MADYQAFFPLLEDTDALRHALLTAITQIEANREPSTDEDSQKADLETRLRAALAGDGGDAPVLINDDDGASWIFQHHDGEWYRIRERRRYLGLTSRPEAQLQVTWIPHEEQVPGQQWEVRGANGRYYQVIKNNDVVSVSDDSYPRHFRPTTLKTLRPPDLTAGTTGVAPDAADDGGKRELLLSLYGEVCTQWRDLADIRFKLLGLLPVVSVVAWTQLLSDPIPGSYAGAGLAAAILGFAITLGIRIYDWRNDGLYDDLISRGRKLEEEMGVHAGIFRGRRKPRSWFVNHSYATNVIYWSVMAGWTALAVWFLIKAVL